MTAGTFDVKTTTHIYSVAERAKLGWFTVDHDGFREFSLSLQQLKRGLGERLAVDHWVEFIGILNRARWRYSITPLPFNSPAFGTGLISEQLPSLLRRISAHEPLGYVAEAEELAAQALSLFQSPSDSLTDCVIELIRADKAPKGTLVVPKATYQSAIAAHLAHRARGIGIDVVTPRELALLGAREAITVVGSTVWYRGMDHVFVTPRASRVMMVRWEWINETLPSEERFAGGHRGKRREPTPPPSPKARESIPASEILLEIDWVGVGAVLIDGTTAAAAGEPVESRLWALANGWAVATRADTDATIRTVDPSLEGVARVGESAIADLEVGDYVALRSGGGGDIIAEIADLQIGDDAARLRGLQLLWKGELRRRIKLISSEGVATSIDTYPQNVQNWASDSPNKIGPGKREDFIRVLTFLGLEDRSKEMWGAVTRLRREHIKAGRVFTKSLVSKISTADLSQLENTGTMVVTLNGVQGAPMQVWRIEDRSEETLMVPESLLLRPIEVGDLWHG